jgi:hypothetical protein
MKIFKRKNTPVRRIEDIKKCVNKLDLIVRNFSKGLDITTVRVSINKVRTRYNAIVGKMTPLLNSPITK